MTVFLEASLSPCWRPGYASTRIMFRAWWGPFALGWLRVPFEEWGRQSYDWVQDGDYRYHEGG